MIKLEVLGEFEAMTAVATLLDQSDGVSRVRLSNTMRTGKALVFATVRPEFVDPIPAELRQRNVPNEEITLSRVEVLGRSHGAGEEAGLVWEDVLGIAARSSRPVARHLAFLFVAGVIACYGILDYNGILIVGAMAISPDLLPITGIGVGIIDRDDGSGRGLPRRRNGPRRKRYRPRGARGPLRERGNAHRRCLRNTRGSAAAESTSQAGGQSVN